MLILDAEGRPLRRSVGFFSETVLDDGLGGGAGFYAGPTRDPEWRGSEDGAFQEVYAEVLRKTSSQARTERNRAR